VADLEALHLLSPIALAVERLGWSADDPVMRDACPTTARGHNLVALLPPLPAAATPVAAGLLSRLGAGAGPALLLASDSELEEWGGRLHALAAGSELHIHVARSVGRASRQLRADRRIDLLVCSPRTALALQARSALRPERLASVVLAWPGGWDSGDDIAEMMQDVPKDAQRVIVGSSSDEIANLAERYARRALEVSAPGMAGPIAPAGPVRTVSTTWGRRVAALADLLELLDPVSAAIWTLDTGHHAAIRHVVPASDPNVTVTTGDVPRVQVVVAFDPPTPTRLHQLLAAGEVVTLVPPAAEDYIHRIAATRRPLRLPGALDAATSAAEARRRAIAEVLERGGLDRAFLTLAPLFDRYDGTAVAAALFDLWTSTGTSAATPDAKTAPADTGATAKVFVGVGKKHGATVNDLVAVLTKEVRLDKTRIGRVELREGFMLVEVPASEAERVAAGLNGTTIRRTRVVARVDASRESRVAGRKPRESGRPTRSARPPRLD
jgi:ATP-dependent RNA helicase DeaD